MIDCASTIVEFAYLVDRIKGFCNHILITLIILNFFRIFKLQLIYKFMLHVFYCLPEFCSREENTKNDKIGLNYLKTVLSYSIFPFY
jgi:hypothetical protein